MMARNPSRALLTAGILLLSMACAACGDQRNTSAQPSIADPAPSVAASPPEDRGKQPATATPGAEERALGYLEAGEAERAASKRGHESAGEPAPVAGGSGG